MNVIVVSDIWGNTEALELLASQLNSVSIIDPYLGVKHHFDNEKEAYNYFQNKVGINKYSAYIHSFLEQNKEPYSIIGFSVGANAVWRLSGKLKELKCQKFVGFYGSQLRHMTQLIPTIPTHLVFPQTEPHFDINQLIAKLSHTPNVTLEQVPFQHGFMNEKSDNYSETGLIQLIYKLKNLHLK